MSELSAVKAWAKEAQDYIEANIPKTGAGDLGVARAVAVGALMSLRLKLQRLHRALPTTAGDVETARLLVETLSHEEGELSEAQQAVRQVCNALISLSAALSGDGRKSHYCCDCSKQWFDDDLKCDDAHCPFKVKP